MFKQFIIVLILLIATVSSAQSYTELEDNKKTSVSYEYFVPNSPNILLDAVKFVSFQSAQSSFSLGPDVPVVWVRITVRNHSKSLLTLFLNHKSAYFLKNIEIHDVDDGAFKSYNLLMASQHSLLAGGSLIHKFSLKEQQKKVFYIKNTMFSFQLLSFSVDTLNNTITDMASKHSVAYFICYFLLSFAAYNLMLFLLGKRKEHLFYSLYLSNAGLGLMYLYGLLYSDFGFYGEAHQWFVLTSLLVPLFLSLFVQSVFDTQHQHHHSHLLLNGVIVLSLADILLALIDLPLAVFLNPLTFIASFIVLLYVIVVFYRRKHPLIKLFFISYFLYLLGMLITMLAIMNIGLPLNTYTFYSSGVALVIEGILFSYLLYYRINSLENDVTIQRNNIILQNKKNQMGDMIGAITHQWKQPLTAIGSVVTLLQYKLDDHDEFNKEELQESFSKISDKVQFMSETINDFSHFFQPDSKSQMVHIEDVIKRASSFINDDFLSANVELKTELSFNKPINTFHNELLHIILNILQNALETFSHRNVANKKLFISGKNTENLWEIEIEDNAGGIDESILPKIFDEYFTSKSEKSGAGMGLFLNRFILEKRLKGHISAENITQGSRFTIVLEELEV